MRTQHQDLDKGPQADSNPGFPHFNEDAHHSAVGAIKVSDSICGAALI